MIIFTIISFIKFKLKKKRLNKSLIEFKQINILCNVLPVFSNNTIQTNDSN